jgi:hypothetical protein
MGTVERSRWAPQWIYETCTPQMLFFSSTDIITAHQTTMLCNNCILQFMFIPLSSDIILATSATTVVPNLKISLTTASFVGNMDSMCDNFSHKVFTQLYFPQYQSTIAQ